METHTSATQTGSQAVVIGGDLYFLPEGENFAKEIAEGKGSDELQVTLAGGSDEWQVSSEEQAQDSVDHPITQLPDDPIARWPEEPILTQPPPKYQGGIKAWWKTCACG